MVMKIGDGGESRSNKVCGVRFIVASFPTYSIEQFTAEGEVRHEIYCGIVSESFGLN